MSENEEGSVLSVIKQLLPYLYAQQRGPESYMPRLVDAAGLYFISCPLLREFIRREMRPLQSSIATYMYTTSAVVLDT